MKISRFISLLVLVVALAGMQNIVFAQADTMCPLIDVYEQAFPYDGGEDGGGLWQGYLAAGSVVQYAIDYEGTGGYAAIEVWSGIVAPWSGGPPDVYSEYGAAPISGSFTIATGGNYTIDAYAGSETLQGENVSVLVEATCQQQPTCEVLGTVSGPPGEGSTLVTIEADTLVTITAEITNPECPVVGNLHAESCAGPLVAQASGMGSALISLNIADAGTYALCIGALPDWAGESCWEETVTLTAYSDCDLLPSASNGPVGCQALMRIPETAVGGAFVADAETYWKPGEQVVPEIVLPAGTTAWVLGMDETGEYYKIIWVCDYLWVPAETLGPNYDGVWHGKPLPTDTVN